MEWILLGIYWWLATMFGWWYWYPVVKEEWRVGHEGENELTAIVMSVVVTPLFWPLVIAYALQDKAKKEKAEQERLRNSVG